MNDASVRRLALVYAKQAEIEGMIAENKIAERDGDIFPYTDEYFNRASAELERIANMSDYELTH